MSRMKPVKPGIWSEIPESTVYGDGTKIGRLCHIDEDVVIGNNVSIQGGVYIPPLVRIGNNVFVGPCVVFTNDRYPASKRLVPTFVEDGVVIGANCTIGPGITVGQCSVIAQGSNVVTDVKPFMVYAGNPATAMQTREEYEAKKKGYEND